MSQKAAHEPLVTVVIPCFNQGRFLAEAIDSALTQTWRRREVIVIDDGSSDDTPRVVGRFSGITAVRQPNQGLAHARNRGLSMAGGDFVLFLDSDDRLRPRALEIGAIILTGNAHAAFCGGRHRTITEEGNVLLDADDDPPADDVYTGLLRRNLFTMPGTVMYRTALLRAAGGFSTALPACQDYDVYMRLAQRYPVVQHQELVGDYRQHSDSMSRTYSRTLASTLRVLHSQKAMARTPERRRALAEGRAFWRGYYGMACLRETHAHLIERRFAARDWRALLTLARHAPRHLAAYSTHARHSNSLPFRVGDDANTPPPRPLRASRGSLRLLELIPAQTDPGGGFQIQPSGLSAIAVRCRNASLRTHIVIDGVVLATEFAHEGLLTGFVPRQLYSTPGWRRVYLIDG